VVVFSNSVIFQASALYKQMPGIDYAWHSVALVLDPDSDVKLAEKRLNAAVESVYSEYRARIEKQHAAFQQSVDVHLTAPRPETRVKFTDAGLEYSVRYPVEMKNSAETDERVLKALYEEVEKEPKLKLAPSGRPRLQIA
jgi:hypothetical protein